MRNRSAFVVAAVGVLALAAGSLAFQPGSAPKTEPKAEPKTQPTTQPSGQPAGQPGERGGGRGQGRGPGGEGGQRGGNVEGAMKQMNRALKALTEQIKDTTKTEENLRLVNEIQRGCAASKGLGIPAKLLEKAKDEAGKKKLAEEFRKDLIAAMRALLEVEELLAAGKVNEAATKLEVIGEMAEKAHTALGVE